MYPAGSTSFIVTKILGPQSRRSGGMDGAARGYRTLDELAWSIPNGIDLTTLVGAYEQKQASPEGAILFFAAKLVVLTATGKSVEDVVSYGDMEDLVPFSKEDGIDTIEIEMKSGGIKRIVCRAEANDVAVFGGLIVSLIRACNLEKERKAQLPTETDP